MIAFNLRGASTLQASVAVVQWWCGHRTAAVPLRTVVSTVPYEHGLFSTSCSSYQYEYECWY